LLLVFASSLLCKAQNTGSSLYCNGIGGYVEIPDTSFASDSVMTVEAWINVCKPEGDLCIVSKGNENEGGGYYFGLKDGRLEFRWGADSGWSDLYESVHFLYGNSPVQVKVVCTFNGIKFYKNGTLLTGKLYGKYSLPGPSGESIVVGAKRKSRTEFENFFRGGLDEIRISHGNPEQSAVPSIWFSMDESWSENKPPELTNKGNAGLKSNGRVVINNESPRIIQSLSDVCLRENRNSINFQGKESYIGIPYNDNLFNRSGMTFEMWINPCEVKRQVLLSQSWCAYQIGGYSFGILEGGRLGFSWEDDGNCAPTNVFETIDNVIVPGKMQHIVVSHDSTGVWFFVDGNFVSGSLTTGSYSKIILQEKLPVLLGASRSFAGELGGFYHGKMSELRIWSRLLSMEEISTRMNSPLTGNEDGLAAYYPMNENVTGSGFRIQNKALLTGDQVDGTIHGTSEGPYSDAFSAGNCSSVNENGFLLDQTIVFPEVFQKDCRDPDFQLNATASSGLPVIYSADGPAAIQGSWVYLTGEPGMVTITALQQGSNSYRPAVKTTSFLVLGENCTRKQGGAQHIYVEPVPSKRCTDPPFQVYAYSDMGLPLEYEIVSGPGKMEGNSVILDSTGGWLVIRIIQKGNDVVQGVIKEIFVEVDDSLCSRTSGRPTISPPDRSRPVIYELITPDNDGKNDFLFIDNLEYFPENRLTIYNSWGNIVYDFAGYSNNWDGGTLPEGGYWYTFTAKNSMSYSGYMMIIRDKNR
jgi:gliding motility-associated-like protein